MAVGHPQSRTITTMWSIIFFFLSCPVVLSFQWTTTTSTTRRIPSYLTQGARVRRLQNPNVGEISAAAPCAVTTTPHQSPPPRIVASPLPFRKAASTTLLLAAGGSSEANVSEVLDAGTLETVSSSSSSDDDIVLENNNEDSTDPELEALNFANGDATEADAALGWKRRLRAAIPGTETDSFAGADRLILSNAIPSMINLAVVPLVNSVDTFWVGRMGIALALAGQAASNQAVFTIYFLVAFLPTITAPLVASAVGSGDSEEAQRRVGESLFLCNVLGGLGTLLLIACPRQSLRLVLPEGAAAIDYAAPYLRVRGLGVIPSLLSATGFAAYRGLLNTVTPLKVSLFTNVLNLVLDPLLIFATPLGFVGAALATLVAETASGLVYLKLLLKRKLVTLRLLVQPPPLKSIMPILQGGLSILGRQLALNIALLAAARRAQQLDPTSGVAAAAYGIVQQMHSLGIVIHVAMQGTAAALVPAALAQRGGGPQRARQVADRLFVWGSLVGLFMGLAQYFSLPFLVPLFSPLPEVQAAVRRPAALSAMIHVINGPVFVGEGIMLGCRCFRDLMLVTAGGMVTMIATLNALDRLGMRLEGIWFSFAAFCTWQGLGVLFHYLKLGPLAVRRRRRKEELK